jgi:2-C-methyl-D-erythritol 4-phosphate cytidylyltransferase
MRSAAIITAAGSGSRMGLETNKVLLPLIDKAGDTTCQDPGLSRNRTVIETAIQSFAYLNKFQKIIVTHSSSDKVQLQSVLKGISVPIIYVEGGSTRQQSVYNGLRQLIDDNPDTVLIHDAARPWITEELVDAVLLRTECDGSAVPVIPSVNAMKLIDENGKITNHLKREKTVSAQTPQGFNFRKILNAHAQAESDGYEAIDDTELWDRYIGKVSTVPGDTANIKITYKEDLNKL